MTIFDVVGALFLSFCAYFLSIPALRAMRVNHPNKRAIVATTYLLWWTIIGWIVALIWSLTEGDKD